MPLMTPETLSLRVIDMFNEAKAEYRLIQHAPEGRCEEVSRLRGNNPREAIKAMLVSVKISSRKSERALALLPGDATMDFAKLANVLGVKSVGMAVRQDVINMLDSEPGGVSPFSFNSNIPVLIDEVLLMGKNVYFSAGKTDESITMSVEEFKRVSLSRGARILAFCSLPSAVTFFQPSPSETIQPLKASPQPSPF